MKALSAAGAGKPGFTLRGAGASLADVEVVATSLPLSTGGGTTSGPPRVQLHGHAAAAAAAAGLDATKLRVTISHGGEYAVAVAAL